MQYYSLSRLITCMWPNSIYLLVAIKGYGILNEIIPLFNQRAQLGSAFPERNLYCVEKPYILLLRFKFQANAKTLDNFFAYFRAWWTELPSLLGLYQVSLVKGKSYDTVKKINSGTWSLPYLKDFKASECWSQRQLFASHVQTWTMIYISSFNI